MTIACVLLKKGAMISNQVNNSLKNKLNCFNDFYFDKFTQGKDFPKLQHYLNEDIKVYAAFE